MKPDRTSWIVWSLLLLIGAGIILAVLFVPRHPVAILRVIDAARRPVTGAIIKPEGLRTKPGPYRSGWYGWPNDPMSPTNAPVITDADGYAHVPYPKHVFERIETGVVIVSVDHPDYVPAQQECIVTTALPAGAPLNVRLQDLLKRIITRSFVARPAPIVLQDGAIARVTVASGANPGTARLFMQVSGSAGGRKEIWERPAENIISTRRLSAGSNAVRAVQIESNGIAWFSDVISIKSVAGQTNELTLALKRGANVRGRITGTSQPVRNGRAIAEVRPIGHRSEDYPPIWHAWSPIAADGSFEIRCLPAGNLEVVAVCDDYVSTNGTGQFPTTHYPQKHVFGSNDLDITIGMEATACLEVLVSDPAGRALPDARVAAWPNVRYGEWSATIIGSDCYNTAELFTDPPEKVHNWWRHGSRFSGTTDLSGLVLMRNLPKETRSINVEHAKFVTPIMVSSWGNKHREVAITLAGGETNHISVQLEPRGSSEIGHY